MVCSSCELGLDKDATCFHCGEQGELVKGNEKSYNFLKNFCLDYCKDEKERKEFFKHLNNLIETEIELEQECNQ